MDITGIDMHQDSRTADHIITLVDSVMKNNVQEFLICEKEYMHIYCLFNYDAEQSRKIKELINRILIIVKDYLMGFDQYEVTIGIGSEQESFDKIRFSILEAYRAVCNRMHCGIGRLIYLEEIPSDTDLGIWKRFEDKKNIYTAVLAIIRDRTSRNKFWKFMEILCRKMLIQQNIMELQKNWLTCFFLSESGRAGRGKKYAFV